MPLVSLILTLLMFTPLILALLVPKNINLIKVTNIGDIIHFIKINMIIKQKSLTFFFSTCPSPTLLHNQQCFCYVSAMLLLRSLYHEFDLAKRKYKDLLPTNLLSRRSLAPIN